MKKFAGNMIFCGAAFALLVAMTASNAQAQYNNFRMPEPPRPNPMQVPIMQAPVLKAQPAQVTMPPRQQQHPIVPATAVIPLANHHKPAPVVMPNHHRPVAHMPPVRHEPPRYVQPVIPAHPVVIAPPHVCPEPQTVIVVQPRPTLLEKLIDKIF